jgi:uncharacterized protein (DUF1330 family)
MLSASDDNEASINHQGHIMAAYAIGSITFRSTEWQNEYGKRMPALVAKHGGKLAAKSAPLAMEGAPAMPEVIALIEFPSATHAQAWYDDPDHASLKELRQGGADFSMVLVTGA